MLASEDLAHPSLTYMPFNGQTLLLCNPLVRSLPRERDEDLKRLKLLWSLRGVICELCVNYLLYIHVCELLHIVYVHQEALVQILYMPKC